MSYIEPGKQAIRIKRGAEFSLGPFSIEVDGVDLNLTGATVTAQLRASKSRVADLLAEFTVDVTVGGDTGYLSEIELILTDTQAGAITNSEGFYDVLVTDAGDNDIYYLEGSATIEGSVTVKP